MTVIVPCEDPEELRAYIAEKWLADHVLVRDEAMFDFQYRTPWVDHRDFPEGISVLCARDAAGNLVGFSGAIATPYPRPCSYWRALWHVRDDHRGQGLGGALLEQMRAIAEPRNGWLGTFGAGPMARPVYRHHGFGTRSVYRWLYEPTIPPSNALKQPRVNHEVDPPEEWFVYRYERHPRFVYSRVKGVWFRVDENDWGLVGHVVYIDETWPLVVGDLHRNLTERSKNEGRPALVEVWSPEWPGTGWRIAPHDVPSVFHPPERRGSVRYAAGWPFLPRRIGLGDADQDRPN